MFQSSCSDHTPAQAVTACALMPSDTLFSMLLVAARSGLRAEPCQLLGSCRTCPQLLQQPSPWPFQKSAHTHTCVIHTCAGLQGVGQPGGRPGHSRQRAAAGCRAARLAPAAVQRCGAPWGGWHHRCGAAGGVPHPRGPLLWGEYTLAPCPVVLLASSAVSACMLCAPSCCSW